MNLGSQIADVFNAPIGNEDWNERTHQDFIIENLGFAAWVQNGTKGLGKTFTDRNARDVAIKGGWAGNNFERNAKEWTRHNCHKQPHRRLHGDLGQFNDEGWSGRCGANEVTCRVSGFGKTGLLSYDWKHFPFEDYDEWMWSDSGPWVSGFEGQGERRPHFLTLEMGLQTCWHVHDMHDKHEKGVNTTMLQRHIKDMRKLMAAVRRAVDHASLRKGGPSKEYPVKNPTTVVVVTSGSVGLGDFGAPMNNCILKLNRIASNLEHEFGFAVLERGEIERRIMYKLLFTDTPFLKEDMYLPQPVQNIVATCLLHLFTCLDAYNGTSLDQASMPASTPSTALARKPFLSIRRHEREELRLQEL